MSRNVSSGTTPQDNRNSAMTRYVVRGWLPILIVLCLVLWLSGGFPPTAWKLLFSLLGHWGALQATQGSTLVTSFVIVLIQSLLILVAWIILILVCIYEVRVIRELNDQERIARLQRALDDASTSGSSSASAASAMAASNPTPVVAPIAVAAPVAVAPQAPMTPMMSVPVASAGGSQQAAFDDYEDEDNQAPFMIKPTGVRMDSTAPQELEYEDEFAANALEDTGAFPDNPFAGNSNPFGAGSNPGVVAKKSRGVRISGRSGAVNGSGNLDGIDPLALVAPGPVDMDAGDPFSAGSDVLDFFLEAKQPATPATPVEEEEPEEEAEPIFVYGNPFEGELPEVFSYDKDLARSVEDLQEETREREAARGGKAGQNKTEQADEKSGKRG